MDAASIEQMNKLRKSLGLPPLAVPGVSSSSADGPTFKPSKEKDSIARRGHHSTREELLGLEASLLILFFKLPLLL